MDKNMIKVELSGNVPELCTDYNGERYCFLRGKEYVIPIEVYENVVVSGHIFSRNLMPVQIDTKELEDKNEMLQGTHDELMEEVKRLKEIIEKLQKGVKDDRAKPKTARKTNNGSASARK